MFSAYLKLKKSIAENSKKDNAPDSELKTGADSSLDSSDSNSNQDIIIDQFKKDVKHIRSFRVLEERIEPKKKAIADYFGLIEPHLEEPPEWAAYIIRYLAVWAIDTRSNEIAFKCLSCVMDNTLGLPESFKEAPAGDFLIKNFTDLMIDEIKAGRSPNPMLQTITEKIESGKWEVISIDFKARPFKYLGDFYEKAGEDELALLTWEKAFNINENSGVKTKIAKMKNKLGK